MDSFYAPDAFIMPANQSTVNILYAYDALNDEPIHRITKMLLLADGGVYDNLANESGIRGQT